MMTVLLAHVLLVALLATGVSAACRWGRFRPSICHALWLVVLVKLTVPPILAWPISVQEILPPLPETFVAIEQAASTPHTAASDVSTPPETPPQAPIRTDSSIAAHFVVVLAGIWLAGCLVALARHIARLRRLCTVLKHAEPAPDWLQERSSRLAIVLGVPAPRVMAVPGITSALVWNPWRSTILVSPDLFDKLEQDEWDAILVHELAHLKRRDLWIGWLELAAACIWWWNPLLMLVRRRLHLYAELASDAWVLWALPESANRYAEVLFKIVNPETRRHTLVPAFGMAAGSAGAFKARLSFVIEGGAACRIPKTAVAIMLVLLMAAIPSPTSMAKSSVCAQQPITYDGSAPETTRDANAVLETRIYVVKDGITGLENPLPSSDMGGTVFPALGLKFLCGEITPNTVNVGGANLVMQGDTLRWNGKDEPESRKIAHVASPALALRGDEDVAVAAALPVEVMKWLRTKKGLQFSYTVKPDKDNIRLWLNVVTPQADDWSDDSSPSSMWTALLAQAPLNQWGCLVAGIRDAKKERATLLMFWKRRLCDPARPDEQLAGPTHGEFLIRHQKHSPPDPQHTFTAELKVVEIPSRGVEGLVGALPPETNATTTPANLRLYRIAEEGEAKLLFDRLMSATDAKLISAPRVTFNTGANAQLFAHKAVLLLDDAKKPKTTPLSINDELGSFSTSLVEFFEREHPQAIIVDFTTVEFNSADPKPFGNISSGIALAMATATEVRDGVLDVNLFVGARELIRHHRGHLFWKKELKPGVVEKTAYIKTPCPVNGGLCFVTEGFKPETLRLAVLTLEPASAPARSADVSDTGSKNESL